MKDALLLVDLVNDFHHEDGDRLRDSFRARHDGMLAAIADARRREIPIIYANDDGGGWDGDALKLVKKAVQDSRGGALIAAIAPQAGDRFIVKPRYSAFDHTPLVLILRQLEVERILLAGAVTEMCVVQTAIDARELGFKITVLPDACASVDERNEQLALEYLERVVGAFLERSTR